MCMHLTYIIFFCKLGVTCKHFKTSLPKWGFMPVHVLGIILTFWLGEPLQLVSPLKMLQKKKIRPINQLKLIIIKWIEHND